MPRKKAEKQTIIFSSDNAEVYNKPLSMEELRDALRRAHDTSADKDKDCLYAYLPEKRSPFRSTAVSGQKSNSSSGGD